MPDAHDHPAWHVIYDAYTLRLSLWKSAALTQEPKVLAEMMEDGLGDEISELDSYMFAGAPWRSPKTREAARMALADEMTAAGSPYSETEALLRHPDVANKGRPVSRRAVDVDAYEMKSRGISLRRIAEQMCDCPDRNSLEHTIGSCMERFRQGIRNVEKLLRKLKDLQPKREQQWRSLAQARIEAALSDNSDI